MKTTDNRRIANVNNPREVFDKAVRWIKATRASYFVLTYCPDPFLLTYRRTQNANFWVIISLDTEDGFLDITVSNGLMIPDAFIPKVSEFLKAINDIEMTSLEISPRYSEIRSSQAIELFENKTKIEDIDIVNAFTVACKEIDDCTLPLLAMIYGEKTVADAVADYLENQKITLDDWYDFNKEDGPRKQMRVNPH